MYFGCDSDLEKKKSLAVVKCYLHPSELTIFPPAGVLYLFGLLELHVIGLTHTGKAGFADFKSNPRGGEPNSYLLEWQSESRTRITEFELRYKSRDEHSWTEMKIAPIATSNFIYAGKHPLSGLRPAMQYEATVAAKNQEGWSRHSKVFHFATFGAGNALSLLSAPPISIVT